MSDHVTFHADGSWSWEMLKVTPLTSIQLRQRDSGPHRVVQISTGHKSQDLEIYVSPTGRSVRVYRNHEELT